MYRALGDTFQLLDADVAIELGKGEAHLTSHEASEMAQSQPVAVRLGEQLLRGVESIDGQIPAGWGECDMLKAGEYELGVRNVIAARIEDRRLQLCPPAAWTLLELANNPFQLVTFARAAAMSDQALKVEPRRFMCGFSA
ncbi:MAG: hypothetical protein U0531_09615 [Dehalococcoidia bacterium]